MFIAAKNMYKGDIVFLKSEVHVFCEVFFTFISLEHLEYVITFARMILCFGIKSFMPHNKNTKYSNAKTSILTKNKLFIQKNKLIETYHFHDVNFFIEGL